MPSPYAGEIQPPWPFTINRDSPQAQGLVFWAPLGIAGNEFDLVQNLSGANSGGSREKSYYAMGSGRNFIAANSQHIEFPVSVAIEPLTLSCWAIANDVTTTGALFSIDTAAGSARWTLLAAGASAGDPVVAYVENSAGGNSSNCFVNGYTAGVLMNICGTYRSPTNREMWFDGGRRGTDTDATSISVGGTDRTRIGARVDAGAVGAFFDGMIFDCRVYNRAFNASEASAYFSDPRLSLNLYWPLGRRSWSFPWR